MAAVKVGHRVYRMSREEAGKLLEELSSLVPLGVYAVRKGADYYELMNRPMSVSQIKRFKKDCMRQGIKVYANGI